MKNINTKIFELHQIKFDSAIQIRTLLVAVLFLLTSSTAIQAQEKQYSKPSWWFGVAAAGNLNFYRGSTQMLNASLTPPTAFHNGFGSGLFVAPSIEYYKSGTRFGFILQAGYDSRVGKFNTEITPCNCPADLDAKLTYITIEPSIRFAPFKSNFFLYGGPRFAFNHDKSFTYSLDTNPAFPLQVKNPDIQGDFSEIKETIVSMQIGLGFDIPLNSTTKKTQYVVSPFVSYHPYFGQNPRGVETWNVSTVRVGFVLKFGQGRLIETPVPVQNELQLSIQPPTDVVTVKTVREVFPVRNYVFFDQGSTAIPARYVVLDKSQVADFKEDKVQLYTPANMSGRSERQMVVYYNVLNILGDRMVKNPNTTIKLVGSSEKGSQDGVIMAQNIKNYLVDTFDIASSRIAVEGREKPLIASAKNGATMDLELLEAGNRRVSIESNSPELLMEFQTGQDAPLKPVEIYTSNQGKDDVVFNVAVPNEVIELWSLQVTSKDGTTQSFGPYTESKISIPRATLMGNQPSGDFKMVVSGTTKTGTAISKESSVYLTPYVAPEVQESQRFSILYEYDESKSIYIYEKYLTEIVAPKIPLNALVVITGHTDIIGNVDYNKTLSLARANDVKGILEKSLAAAGRTDVTLTVTGDGEDETLAPFENKYPEERFYNRTVVIDVTRK